MSQINTSDLENNEHFKPGAFLAAEREKRGVTLNNMANKLNLREQVLSHLEADEYQFLPESVFIQGYIRAYCKYLEIGCADELIAAYQVIQPPVSEAKFDKNVWMKPASNGSHHEKWLYRITSTFVLIAILSVGLWWYQNKADDKLIPSQFRVASVNKQENVATSEKVDVKITDISKMRQIFTNQLSANSNNMSTVE